MLVLYYLSSTRWFLNVVLFLLVEVFHNEVLYLPWRVSSLINLEFFASPQSCPCSARSLFSGLHPLLFFFHEDVYYFSYLRGEPAMLMPREVDHCHVFRDGFLRDLCRPYYIIVALEMLSLEALFARMICLSWPNSLFHFWFERVTPGVAFVNISSKIPLAYWIALVLSDDNPTS